MIQFTVDVSVQFTTSGSRMKKKWMNFFSNCFFFNGDNAMSSIFQTWTSLIYSCFIGSARQWFFFTFCDIFLSLKMASTVFEFTLEIRPGLTLILIFVCIVHNVSLSFTFYQLYALVCAKCTREKKAECRIKQLNLWSKNEFRTVGSWLFSQSIFLVRWHHLIGCFRCSVGRLS